MNPRITAIESKLAVLAPVSLIIKDDSQSHVGHHSANGGGHFSLQIVSAQFSGKNRMTRHRMIYSALGELMQGDIHALNIMQAQTPEEI